MSVLVNEMVYSGFFGRATLNDKIVSLPLANAEAEVPYAIKATDKLVRQIDEALRFLENIDKLAEVKLDYQECLDKCL